VLPLAICLVLGCWQSPGVTRRRQAYSCVAAQMRGGAPEILLAVTFEGALAIPCSFL